MAVENNKNVFTYKMNQSDVKLCTYSVSGSPNWANRSQCVGNTSGIIDVKKFDCTVLARGRQLVVLCHAPI